MELVKKIRNDSASPDRFMPIIMVAAHSERPRIIAARDAGINEFVMKPVSARTLFSRLNAVIEHPRRYVRAGEYFGPDRRRKWTFVDFERGDDTQEMSQDEINDFLNPDQEDSEAGQAEVAGTVAKSSS